MPKNESKTKKNDTKAEPFVLEDALSKILNPFLNKSFRVFITGMDIKTEKEFNTLYNQFLGGKTN